MSNNVISIAHRVWAEPNDPRTVKPKKQLPLAREILVFDTETLIDAPQALTFGSWQYCRRYEGGLDVVDEGLFYADDLPESNPNGYAVLGRYVTSHARANGRTLQLRSRSDFVEKVFYRAAYSRRARVVGFNLPFDLSRIAIAATEARGINLGGFSLILSAPKAGTAYGERRHRPRVSIKHRDAKGAFISFSKPMEPDSADLVPPDSQDGLPVSTYIWPGRFLDLRTLAFALTGNGYSLEGACQAYGVQGKHDPGSHGQISESYIDYCRQDVTGTRELHEALLEEFDRHPIDLDPERAYSPASMAKAYLAAMGITPILGRQPDFPRPVLGYAMAAFFGGRAECKIRRTPVPVATVDFTSMYPTVSANMGLYDYQIAEALDVEDATDSVRAMLDGVTLEDCFRPEFWKGLVGFALVEPTDDIFPVRAAYDDTTWGIGINFVTSTEPLWYSLADCVASALLTGRPPKILQSLRLIPKGRIGGLTRTRLRGTLDIDPNVGDPIVAMVQERQRVKADLTLSDSDRKRTGDSLKLIGNSGAYGIYSEFNARGRLKGKTTPVTVHGRKSAPFADRVASPEDPGTYCFPPFATCITGAARLMLAMLERCVVDLGGSWAFCDTDSMAIVATNDGGPIACSGGSVELADGSSAIRALSYDDVEAIRGRFNSLNPYDQSLVPHILKLEEKCICFAISAKRYALYDFDEQGEPVFLVGDHAPSEHGLGQFLNPQDSSSESDGWVTELWRYLVRQAHGLSAGEPEWFTRPTMLKTTVTSPMVLRAFRTFNEGKSYREQVKPFNFMMTAAGSKPPAGIASSDRFRLIAPWDPEASHWLERPWVDVHHPSTAPYWITTKPDRPGLPKVDTFRDVAAKYLTHPESKSADQVGERCRRITVGLLQRRHVSVGRIVLIGKESNRLDERKSGELTHEDREAWLTTYEDNDEWYRVMLPLLREFGVRRMAKIAGISERRTRDLLAGRSLPHAGRRRQLVGLTSEFVSP